MIVYIQVGNFSKNSSIKSKYEKEEQAIKNLWQTEGQIK
jgi:hypothetical protein